MQLVEYVRPGESVDDWTELVTVLRFTRSAMPEMTELLEVIRQEVMEGCPASRFEIVEQGRDDAIYEAVLKGCAQDRREHLIVRLLAGGSHLHSVQYAVRPPKKMNRDRRERWMENLRAIPAPSRSTRTYMGREVTDFAVPVAGGQVVHVPVTDQGPIPAENDDFKVEVAGINLTPSAGDPESAALFWSFMLTDKSGEGAASIRVEEVAPSPDVVGLVEDPSPDFTGGSWSHELEPVRPGPVVTPWLYEDGASIFVFRFTIDHGTGEPTVLHQLAWFPVSAKQALLDALTQSRSD